MSKKTTKTAKAVETARASITERPNDTQRATLIIVRPTTAKAIADGWTLAIQDRKGQTLLGEMQLAAFLAGKDKGEKGEKESAKSVVDECARLRLGCAIFHICLRPVGKCVSPRDFGRADC